MNTLTLLLTAALGNVSPAPAPEPVDALLYSTMPSTFANRAEMALDGDDKTAFRSYYGMEEGDEFRVVFGRPMKVGNIKVVTGTTEGDDRLSDAVLEVSNDGSHFGQAAAFGADGTATLKGSSRQIAAFRIRMNPGRAASHLVIREIKVDTKTPLQALRGPGRGFVDISEAPELKNWADRAERQMESFWAETASMLYSDGFVTPNAVHVIYTTGPNVTPVAATGGGVMTVNTAWCKAHDEDTGLTVHEMAHVVQSGGAPGWLIEAVADYIRWVKFEPENYHPRIDVRRATPHDPYRTGATFLGWCELHYDHKLVTKLNDDARFGRYSDALFLKYCGKDIQTLWKEFLADYQKDPEHVLVAPVPAAMRPRVLPTVQPGTSVSSALTFDILGVSADGKSFPESEGFDSGATAYSAELLSGIKSIANVEFKLGPSSAKNTAVAQGQSVSLTGRHHSLWLLGAAVDGGQRNQVLTITYADGTTQQWDQNFSDWYQPEDFPGERRAKMAYRNLANGAKDPRTFYVYAYGFALDPAKEVVSVKLPNNENVRILAVSTAD